MVPLDRFQHQYTIQLLRDTAEGHRRSYPAAYAHEQHRAAHMPESNFCRLTTMQEGLFRTLWNSQNIVEIESSPIQISLFADYQLQQ
ncbi:hypothetical protein D3C81_1905490 [compost metagenome]